MPVFHLLYRSAASPTLEFRDLEDILLISRIHNARDGITGLLVYRDFAFLQLLEGDAQRVRATVERIREDPRNFNLEVLAEIESEERLMPKWSMAWVDARNVGLSSKVLFQLFDLALDEEVFKSPGSILQLLRDFSQGAQTLLID
jgi:hypothetical protein